MNLNETLMENQKEIKRKLKEFVPVFSIGQTVKTLKYIDNRYFKGFNQFFDKKGRVIDYKVLTGVFSTRIAVEYFIDFGKLGCIYIREEELDHRFKKQGLFYSHQLDNQCECGQKLLLILIKEAEIEQFKKDTFIVKDTLVKCFHCHYSGWISQDTYLISK